jgi:hypothetical protein
MPGDAPISMSERILHHLLGPALDQPGELERFRQFYCQRCRDTRRTSAGLRAAICREEGCGMCDADEVWRERILAVELLTYFWSAHTPASVGNDALALLNRYMATAGPISPMLERDERGHLAPAWDAPTLKPSVRLAVYSYIAARAGASGHLFRNVLARDGDEVRAAVLADRKAVKAKQIEEMTELHRADPKRWNISALAAHYGKSRPAIRRMLGEGGIVAPP